MAMRSIPKRSEVPVENTWKLEDIFENNEAWTAEYEALKAYPAKIAAFQGKLGESAETLLSAMQLQDEVSLRLEKLHGYASMNSDVDTANNFYQDMKGKALSTYIAIAGAGAFMTPEIIEIPDEKMDAFFAECPGLSVYRRPIEVIRRGKAHTLSAKEEALLAGMGEITEAPSNIRGILSNADLTWPSVTDPDGNVCALTNGSFVNLLESPDQSFRKTVFETYYNRLGEFRNTIAATLDGHFKSLKYRANVRNYPNTLAAALDRTEVPTSVYENLIDAVHKNFDPMYKYVRLRKKMLGVSELHMYDVYTPIVSNAAAEISFEDAKATVLKALAVLGDDYTALLKEGFENRWIDVYENTGKRSGAYSSGTARPHPFVLLNHKDNLDSMFTLAHEMGHALHSYHSVKYQPVATSDYVIFVAEVASTCNEVLLMKYLLKNTTNEKNRAYLINHFLDSFKGTLYRQTMFAEFELMMGRMCENGESLTADALSAKYLELNKLYFGPDMISDDGIALEWARIPHFFYNYYVYQYATGFSAACAIANRILTEGAPAVADYKKFLSGGSSADPISLLKIAGVDMGSPEPVNSALRLFSELVDELEALAK